MTRKSKGVLWFGQEGLLRMEVSHPLLCGIRFVVNMESLD